MHLDGNHLQVLFTILRKYSAFQGLYHSVFFFCRLNKINEPYGLYVIPVLSKLFIIFIIIVSITQI